MVVSLIWCGVFIDVKQNRRFYFSASTRDTYREGKKEPRRTTHIVLSGQARRDPVKDGIEQSGIFNF